MNNFNDENHFPSKTQCKGWYKLVLVEFEKNLQIKKKTMAAKGRIFKMRYGWKKLWDLSPVYLWCCGQNKTPLNWSATK